uniref:3-hydroxyacyl-CoA dehydrogenase type-2 n=1 Tax=Strigamia maritima TaxID=126957 RepID=T1J853_STRMM
MTTIRGISGLVALVSGGASGLGLATAKRLVEKGAKVTICDLKTSNGAELVKELGENAIFSPTDISKEDDIKRALDLTESTFKKLNVVVNCAGVVETYKLYNFNTGMPHRLQTFNDHQNINLAGTFNVIRLAVGVMAKNVPTVDGERGVIVNTSAYSAFDGQCGQISFSANQGGISAMTLPLSRDLASHGIRCCTIAPGLFNTPLTQSLPENIIQFLEDTIPFPWRLGHPEEFAHLVQCIIENPMMNGETIRIDGAMRAISLN